MIGEIESGSTLRELIFRRIGYEHCLYKWSRVLTIYLESNSNNICIVQITISHENKPQGFSESNHFCKSMNHIKTTYISKTRVFTCTSLPYSPNESNNTSLIIPSPAALHLQLRICPNAHSASQVIHLYCFWISFKTTQVSSDFIFYYIQIIFHLSFPWLMF